MLTKQGTRLGDTLRLDAPCGTDSPAYARTPVSHLAPAEGSTGSIPGIYIDKDSSSSPRFYSGHIAALRTERATDGMPLRDARLVPSGVRINHVRTGSLCDSEQSLDKVNTSTGNAEPINARGKASGFTEPAALTAGARTREVIAASRPKGWPEGLRNSRDAWAQVLGNPATLTARTARDLAGAFQHPTARDCLMADVITGAPDHFTSVMLGVFPARPDWARVDTAQEVAFELMKAASEGQRAPMLCLIGWLEWLKGKSSFAARYFKLALEDATNYRLAVLLAELVSRGLVADCARTPDKSYARPRSANRMD